MHHILYCYHSILGWYLLIKITNVFPLFCHRCIDGEPTPPSRNTLRELQIDVEPITVLFSKVCNSEALKLDLALHHMLSIGVSHLSLSRFVDGWIPASIWFLCRCQGIMKKIRIRWNALILLKRFTLYKTKFVNLLTHSWTWMKTYSLLEVRRTRNSRMNT